MRHLTQADYRAMPWANGRGTTLELARADRPGGGLLWRISRAQVVADGPFSRLPGVARSLTVVAGPGFRLLGGAAPLHAAPLLPVAFHGDIAIRAEGVTAPSQDVNVMTWDALPLPQVAVAEGGHLAAPKDGLLAVLALGPVRGPATMLPGDLLIGAGAIVWQGLALTVRLHLTPLPLPAPGPSVSASLESLS